MTSEQLHEKQKNKTAKKNKQLIHNQQKHLRSPENTKVNFVCYRNRCQVQKI